MRCLSPSLFFCGKHSEDELREIFLRVNDNDDCSSDKSGPLPEEALCTFHSLQWQLTSELVMAFPFSNWQYVLITDAANGTAILTQVDKDGKFYAISYASRQLKDHEKNYSPFLLEAAAAIWGMDFFNKYLRGKQFILYTDHKPLEKFTTNLQQVSISTPGTQFCDPVQKGV